MASRLELRLLRAIADSDHQELKAVSQTKLACYLARVGEFSRAEALRLEVRAGFGDGRSAAVSILLMLLDGLLIYYRDLGFKARDRIARANLISLATRSKDLIPLTCAWLAHIDFNQGDYVAMAREIRQCLEAIDDDSEGIALTRVSLVLGDAFLYCGRVDASKYWYERARIAATTQGDQAAIGAMIYNKAALNVQNLRVAAAQRELTPAEVAFTSGELRSAINYQKLAMVKSLDHLLVAANVGVKMIEKDFLQAHTMALELVKSKEIREDSDSNFVLMSDIAICTARMGDNQVAEKLGSTLQDLDIERLEADDRVIIYSNLTALYLELGKSEKVSETALRMAASLKECNERSAGLALLLSEFVVS